MFKIKTKKSTRVFALICSFVILFTFFTSSISALDVGVAGSESGELTHTAPAPVPIVLNQYFDLTFSNDIIRDFPVSVTLAPSSSISDVITEDFKTEPYSYVDVDLTSYGMFRGSYLMGRSTLRYINSESSVGFVGTSSHTYSMLRYSTGGSNVTSYVLQDMNISLSDFYCWNYNFGDNDIGGTTSEVSLNIRYPDGDPFYVSSLDVYYKVFGSNELQSSSINIEYSSGDGEYLLDLSPALLGITERNTLVYIYDLTINFTIVDPRADFLDLDLNVGYVFNPYIHSFISPDENPSFALRPYTEWIATAVGGFFDLEIFPGFSLGGIFMTVVAFMCAIWFLKLVAGG